MHDRNVKSATRIWQILLILWLLMLCAGCQSMPAQQTPGAPATAQSGKITGIETQSGSGAEQVMVNATKSLQYTSVKEINPPRVILVFPDTTIGSIPAEYTPKSGTISRIKLDLLPDKKNVRMEIDLSRDVPYSVTRSGSSLNIAFSEESAAQSATTESVESKGSAETAAAQAMTGTASSQQVQTPSESNASNAEESQMSAQSESQVSESGAPARVNQIDFSGQISGKSTIYIGTTKPVRYEIEKVANRRMILRLYNCDLPKNRRNRPLITTRFDSAVDRITPIQTPGKTDTVDILIELRQQVPYRLERTKDQFALHFDPSTIGPRPLAEANLPEWQQVLNETYQTKVSASQMQAKAREGVSAEDKYAQLLGQNKEYTGQPIALDFYKTDIRNVFKILQQVSGKNYAIDPDVGGTVTISMEKPVPWDQVLDLILKMNKLGMVETGNIIRIAKLSTLQAEESAQRAQLEAIQKRQEQQQALEPMMTEYLPINYANAKSEILPHLTGILTKGRGKVGVDSRNNQIIITDTAEKIKQAKEIISKIDKVTPQVIIEARIVEVNNHFTRALGVNWTAESSGVYRRDIGGTYGYNVAMNFPVKTTYNSNIGFTFNRIAGTPLVLDATLNAEAATDNIKILSSPKVVTLDNKMATISQGVEYPYQNTTASQGVALQTTEFKKIDLTMNVTPHVTPDNRISLKINITKNDIAEITPQNVPALSTSKAETELLVDNGGTIVIGGIMKTTLESQETGFPMLQDIPVLGWLFRSKLSKNTKQELLIFMTPRIVQLSQRKAADLVKVSSGD